MVQTALVVNAVRRLRSVDLRTLLFLLLAIVTARLVWIASRTEIGWELLGCQWQDATLGRFGLRPTSIDALPPAEQAAYWLPQVERILDESPPSAQLAMGAAWVLDSPDQRWQGYSVPIETQDTDPFLARWDKCEESQGRYSITAWELLPQVPQTTVGTSNRGIARRERRAIHSTNQPIWLILPQEGLCLPSTTHPNGPRDEPLAATRSLALPSRGRSAASQQPSVPGAFPGCRPFADHGRSCPLFQRPES
jgi:hypothetical protein